jgi:hypothetical protein
MQTVTMKLVTIVAEAALRQRLGETVMAAGGTGYTITDASGEGSRGMRSSEQAGRNVRVEAVLDTDSASRLVARLAETYFPHYAIVAWMSPVDVVRAARPAPR